MDIFKRTDQSQGIEIVDAEAQVFQMGLEVNVFWIGRGVRDIKVFAVPTPQDVCDGSDFIEIGRAHV